MGPELELLMQRFKALADPVRLRLLALCAQGECSVSELTDVTRLSQPRVSQHLKALCDAGILERFRDGHFVYYRGTPNGDPALRTLLGLLPGDEPTFAADSERLRSLRATLADVHTAEDRALHRALIALTVTAPLGDLLDIGSGHGRLLKLLATRSRRAVGVDIDADARRFARAELLLAGLPNCTLRQGDMYALPFDDSEFDTVILDDVLAEAEHPELVLAEAERVLDAHGRLLLLTQIPGGDAPAMSARLAGWCRARGLRLAPPLAVPSREPVWLLAVAQPAGTSDKAA